MKIKAVIVFVKLLAIVAIVVLTPSTLLVWAEGNQSNQDMNQPAMLLAPEPDFKIKVYPKPNTMKRQIGYGLGGDQVTVIEQVGSNSGSTWNHIRFDNASQLDGWVQEDFVRLQEKRKADDRTSRIDSSKSQNRYKENKFHSKGNAYFGERQNTELVNQNYQDGQQSYQGNQHQRNY